MESTTDFDSIAAWDWYDDKCPCGVPAGECPKHPRARPSQRPPEGDWRVWLALAGRGWGKTRAGAEWVRHRVESGKSRRLALVAPTAADVRDVLIEGESGILSISPPWFMPRYEPSKRRLTWPNGAIATTYSAEEPNRLRGPQSDCAWLDELAAWDKGGSAYDMLMLGLRLGKNPQVCITTTPKATPLVKRIVTDPRTIRTGGNTYENKANLAPEFITEIASMFEGTRLGRQELYAEILELTDGVWFSNFDTTDHVTDRAEYQPGFAVHLAIDCGTSQHTGAVWFQVIPVDRFQRRVQVFGDFISSGSYSAKNAEAIKELSYQLPCQGHHDTVRLDPAAKAQTGIGPSAYSEYEAVFGSRILSKWPSHGVVDGLDQMEIMLDHDCLLVHPRCKALIESFQNYRRKEQAGVIINYPADNQSPHEDMMDALRGGVRDIFPEGRTLGPQLRTIHGSQI